MGLNVMKDLPPNSWRKNILTNVVLTGSLVEEQVSSKKKQLTLRLFYVIKQMVFRRVNFCAKILICIIGEHWQSLE